MRRVLLEQAAAREALLLPLCAKCRKGVLSYLSDWVAEEVLMRSKSEWEVECAVCGDLIVSDSSEGTCPHCGTSWRIEPAEYEVEDVGEEDYL